MDITKDVIWGLAVPLLSAAGLRWLLAILADRFFLANHSTGTDTSEASSTKQVFAWETCLPLALGAGVGYFVLNLGPWMPKANYEWITAGVGLAILVSTIVGFFGQHWAVRFIVLPIAYAATIVATGYFLMPTWDDLWPDYWTYLVCWCVGCFILSVKLDHSKELDTWPFAVVLLGSSLATAGIVFRSGSMRFAQITALSFAVVLGLTLIGFVMRRPLLRGLGLPMVVFLAGMLLIAQTNSFSNVPFLSYWLPLAGILLSLIAERLISVTRFPKLHAISVVLAAAIPSTVAVVMAVVETMPE